MSLRRLGVRLAAVLPAVMFSACTSQSIDKTIADWIKTALWWVAKMILISAGLMMAWALAAILGAALIALGVRRRRFDLATVAAVLAGGAMIVGAWPLVFSQGGLAGVLAPGSTAKPSAGPIVAQALAIVVAVIWLIVFLRRRDKKMAPPLPPSHIAPPGPPAVPPAMLAPTGNGHVEQARTPVSDDRAPRPKMRATRKQAPRRPATGKKPPTRKPAARKPVAARSRSAR